MRKLRYSAIVIALAVSLIYPKILAQGMLSTHEAVPTANSEAISHVLPSNTASPPESSAAQSWGVSRIEAPQAWQLTQEGKPVTVAVLDSGIAEDNQDLAGKVIANINFSSSPTGDDLYGHGTQIAGIIVAIAPRCQLMNVKVADDIGSCQPSVVARGIIWAAGHGADVINASLCVKSSPELEEAVNYAWSQGAILVAAAGNEGRSKPSYPAGYSNCLAVAALDEDDSLAMLSNHGDWVDMAAPGYHIPTISLEAQDIYSSGTSAAAAHVSGTAALVFSISQDTSGNGSMNDEVQRAIKNSCSPTTADGTGKGCVNAFQAVAQAL